MGQGVIEAIDWALDDCDYSKCSVGTVKVKGFTHS